MDDQSRRLAGLFADKVTAIEPGTLDRLMAGTWAASSRPPRLRGSERLPEGAAIIGIHEIILPRPSWVTEIGWGTALSDVRDQLDHFAGDDGTKAIVLHVDSPGGAVDGLPETAAMIRDVRRRKPVIAIADTYMASAAYYLGSQASAVYVTPSGQVGSIGTVASHVATHRFDERLGFDRTLIHGGRYKVERGSHAPLSDEARAYWQGQVDEHNAMFHEAVALGRGGITPREVGERYGEGRMLLAKPALALGMVDGIRTFAETLRTAGAVRSGTQPAGFRAFAYERELYERRSTRAL